MEFRNRFNILAVHWISYIGKINRDFLANSWTLDTVSGQAFKVNIDLRSFIGREQCINALVPTPFHDPTFSTRQSVFATEDVLFHCLVGVDGEDLLFYGLVGDDGANGQVPITMGEQRSRAHSSQQQLWDLEVWAACALQMHFSLVLFLQPLLGSDLSDLDSRG